MYSLEVISCYVLVLTNVMLTLAARDYSCPTWFFYSNTSQKCECGFESATIHCDQQTMKVQMKVGYCVTYSGYDGVFYGSACPFLYKANNSDRLFSELPFDPELLEDAMCGTYNRKGFQCAECIDGYGPAVYSLDRACADCSKSSVVSGICLYFVVACLPITVFFICVVVFRLNIMSGPMLGYVLFCQGFAVAIEHYISTYFYIQSNITTPLRPFVKLLLILFETWNMRFLRTLIGPFCMSSKLDNIHVILLSLIPNLFIIFLVILSLSLIELHARNCGIISLLCKPFIYLLKKTNTTTITSDAIIQAFATFTLLSSTMNIFTIYALTERVTVWFSNNSSTYKIVLFFDSSVELLSSTHIYCLLIASLQCIIFVLLPSVMLLVYPTRIYQYFSKFISSRNQLAIMIFAEALNNCFKDGLNGTRDYRSFAGFMLLCFPLSGVWGWFLQIAIGGYEDDLCLFFNFTFLALFVAYLRPLKSVVANMSLSFYMTLYGVCCLAHYHWEHKVASDDPEKNELVIFLIILSAQIPAVIWTGYNLIYFILRKAIK